MTWSCYCWAAELLISSVASAVQKKKCEEVHLCRSLRNVMLMFFKLQRSHGARESFVINHSGQHAYMSYLAGVCTQKRCEIGLCFDSTSIYGVGLFSESHFLVFSKTFSCSKNNVCTKASWRFLHLLTS